MPACQPTAASPVDSQFEPIQKTIHRDGLVFVGPKGGALSSANFGADVWRPAVTSVGLRGFTFHGLRGVSATLAARQGATTKELMRRLGHPPPTWLCDISEPTPSGIGRWPGR
jgi:integrase